MCFKKKNCLNCVFCLRNRSYWNRNGGPVPISPKWEYEIAPLTEDERELAKNNDFNFVGKKIRDYNEWNKIYTQKKKEEEERIKALPKNLYPFAEFALLPKIFDKHISRKELETLGMDAPPTDVPDEDYLCCWHEQWDEDKNADLKEERVELINKKCQFYFPFLKLENKTLEACDKERKEKLLSKISIKNNIIIPIIICILTGVVAGILVYKYQKWDEQNTKNSQIKQEKIEQKIKENKVNSIVKNNVNAKQQINSKKNTANTVNNSKKNEVKNGR